MKTENKKIINNESESREKFLDKMEEVLESLEADIEHLDKFSKKLKSLEKNIATLSEYYGSDQWLEDYNNTASEKIKNGKYKVTNQDSIFNALQDVYEAKKKILKQIVITL